MYFPGLRGALNRSNCKLSGEPEEGIQPQHEGGETLGERKIKSENDVRFSNLCSKSSSISVFIILICFQVLQLKQEQRATSQAIAYSLDQVKVLFYDEL